MATRELGIEARTISPRVWLPGGIVIGFGLIILFFDAGLLGDADSYWHIAIGNWILGHGFPTTDMFSTTVAGQHWIAKEWLSQLGYAAAFSIGGWPAVGALATWTVALAFGLLALFLSERFAPIIVVAGVAFAFMLVAPHVIARPHALAFPVMVLWIGMLARTVDRGEVPNLALLPLICLWANLHGGFTLGILIAGALGLDAVASAAPDRRKTLFFGWLRFGILTLLAASITPYGAEPMLVTWRILSLGPILSMIGEWQPANFTHLGPLEIVLLLGIGLALQNGFRLQPVRILILVGLLHLALSAARNNELLGLLAPLILMAPLSRQLPEFCRAQPRSDMSLAQASLCLGLIAIAVAPAGYAIAWERSWSPTERITPAAALHAAQAATGGVILNDYDFGGYMIAVGARPFIDGRTELYGGDFTLRVQQALLLQNLPDLFTLMDQYKVEATLLAPTTPAVALLDRTPGWHRIYADATAVVHVRNKGPSH